MGCLGQWPHRGALNTPETKGVLSSQASGSPGGWSLVSPEGLCLRMDTCTL